MVPPIFALLYALTLVPNLILPKFDALLLELAGDRHQWLPKRNTKFGPPPETFIKTKNDALRVLFPIDEYSGTCGMDYQFTSPAHPESSSLPGLLYTMGRKSASLLLLL